MRGSRHDLSRALPRAARTLNRRSPLCSNIERFNCLPNAQLVVLHRDGEVGAFPASLAGPIESKARFGSGGERRGGQIEGVDSEAGVARVGVVRGLPAVDAPMNAAGNQQHNPQGAIARNAASLVVESPSKNLAHMFLDLVTLNGLRRLIKDAAIPDRAPQLYVLGVCPHQRAFRPCGFAANQFE